MVQDDLAFVWDQHGLCYPLGGMLGHLEEPPTPPPIAHFAITPEQRASTLQNGEKHCESCMSCPRTQHNGPSHGSRPAHLTQCSMHQGKPLHQVSCGISTRITVKKDLECTCS